jgi:hypothetical protein
MNLPVVTPYHVALPLAGVPFGNTCQRNVSPERRPAMTAFLAQIFARFFGIHF